MNLTYHHAKKDLDCHKYAILAWIVMLAAVSVGCMRFPMASAILKVSSLFWGMYLIAGLVNTDPLTGSNAFWITRPLRERTLLATKSLIVGGTAVLWLACMAVQLAVTRRGDEIDWCLMNFAVLDLPCLLAIFAISSMKVDKLERTGLTILVLGAVLLVAAGLFVLRFSIARTVDAEYGLFVSPGFRYSALVVALIGIGIESLGVIIHQYLTRRTSRSWLLVAAGALVILTMFHAWRWDFLSPRLTSAECSALETVQIRIPRESLQASAYTVQNHQSREVRRYTNIYGDWEVQHLPSNWIASVQSVQGRLTLPGGKTVQSINYGSGPMNPHQDRQAFIQSLSEDPHLAGIQILETDTIPFSMHRSPPLLTLTENQTKQAREITGQYEATIGLKLRQLVYLGSMPPRSEARWRTKGYQVEVFSVLPQYAQGTHNGVETQRLYGYSFVLDVSVSEWLVGMKNPLWTESSWGGFPPLRFVLVNPKYKQALVTEPGGGWSGGSLPLMALKFAQMNLDFHMALGRKPMEALADDWLEGAVLWIYELQTRGIVQKHCATDLSLKL
jgi:hypothetical protein